MLPIVPNRLNVSSVIVFTLCFPTIDPVRCAGLYDEPCLSAVFLCDDTMAVMCFEIDKYVVLMSTTYNYTYLSS